MSVDATNVHELHASRERRAHRSSVARALATTATADLQGVTWGQLGELPDWCLWADAKRIRLVRVAGALFAAPGMRLWIDAARLRAARALVGDPMFDRVMQAPALPSQAPGLPAGGDLARLLDTAGRAVLLGSLPVGWMRSFAAARLPAADARAPLCPAAVARSLASQALELLAEEHPQGWAAPSQPPGGAEKARGGPAPSREARPAEPIVLRDPPAAGGPR